MRNDRSRTLALLAAILLFGAGLGSRAAAQAEVPAKIRAPERTTPETQGSPASAALGYWQRLTAGATESAAIVWNRQNGAAESIFGTFSGPGLPSEAVARQFLRDNAPLFGMPDDLHELQTSGTLSSPMGHHLLFRQSYQGVPVYAAEAAVHFNKQGRIVAVNSSYQPDIFISVAPTIDLAAAMREATRALRTGDFSQASGALVVYRYASAYVLAWQITVPTSDETWELFVDAQAGGVLGEPRDINRYVNGTGQVFLDNAVVATQNNLLRDNKDAASAVPQSAYATVTLQGLAGTNLLDGIYASSSKTKKRTSGSNNSFVFTRDKLGFSETMGYYYIDYAERYIQTLGFTNVNNRQQVFSANGTAQDNSFYSPSTKQITYGTGGVDDAEDAEVILHEYGHAIQDNQKPGFGSGVEAGAMGEGFGDYWGASVTAHFSGGFQDVCVAEWDATSYSSTDPPCLRRLDSSKHYPQSIVGEVHADGEIWSAALWQIRLALGTPSAADKVILQHHFLIPASASFNTAANALVTAAINLGFKATDVSTMREILRNRGFTVTI